MDGDTQREQQEQWGQNPFTAEDPTSVELNGSSDGMTRMVSAASDKGYLLLPKNPLTKGRSIYNGSAAGALYVLVGTNRTDVGARFFTTIIAPRSYWEPPELTRFNGEIWGTWDGNQVAGEYAGCTEYL